MVDVDLDSSFEGEIERINSDKGFSSVPRDTKFKFKFKDVNGKTYDMIEYTLREGKSLPYSTALRGICSST